MTHPTHRPGLAGRTRLPLAGFLVLILLVMSTFPAAAAWKGDMEKKDGVTVVSNPAASMHGKASAELDELWRVGGDTEDEDEFFGMILSLIVDEEGNTYALDFQLNEVKVYDADGEFVTSFGREGEGPGEFRFPTGLMLLPDDRLGVIQAAPGRIVVFTRDGAPAGEYPIPTNDDGTPFVLVTGRGTGDEVYLILRKDKMDQATSRYEQQMRLARVDDEGTIKAEFCENTRALDFANSVIDEKAWDGWERRWALGPQGKVVANEDWGEYRVKVWNADGTVDRVFGREYKKHSRTKEEIDELKELFGAFTRNLPNAKFDISGHHPAVFRLYALDNGQYWINHSRGSNDLDDGIMGVFDVFDAEGRFLREVTLKGEGNPGEDGYYFIGDRLYVVTDLLSAAMAMQGGASSSEEEDGEEPEPMGIICYQLPDNLLGGS